jgi:hypothetical protein
MFSWIFLRKNIKYHFNIFKKNIKTTLFFLITQINFDRPIQLLSKPWIRLWTKPAFISMIESHTKQIQIMKTSVSSWETYIQLVLEDTIQSRLISLGREKESIMMKKSKRSHHLARVHCAVLLFSNKGCELMFLTSHCT